MIDHSEIIVKSGAGGNGAISFRREKFVPFGGPDGGDGGDGGDVIIKADATIADLHRFVRKRYYQASDGEDGRGKKMHGKKGDNLVLAVPLGTVVSSRTALVGDTVIADLEQPGQQAVVAVGGKGGWGNTHFASSTNQVPEIAQTGEPGEENSVILEMRLIADVGIIGCPNAGKSTLLAAASAARPKIASYPFTTLEPNLGVVKVGQQSFVLAEIPGLLTGAHLGRGLGHEFLRHIIRTRVLLHLLDGSSTNLIDEMLMVNAELSLYDSSLAQKRQVVVVNKIDLPEVQARLKETQKDFGEAGIKAFYISAATGQGIAELMATVRSVLEEVKAQPEVKVTPRKVFRPQPKAAGISVQREGDVYIVVAPGLERIRTRDGVSGGESRLQLRRYLARLGVSRALEKAGVKQGDKVRCGNLEFEW